MTRALGDIGRAQLVEVGGLFDDGWCEPELRVTVRTRSAILTCQFTIWLKPELNRTQCALQVRINGTETMTCRIGYDIPTIVQTACRAGADETVTVEISCDNNVHSKGSDLRRLSFLLSSLSFS